MFSCIPRPGFLLFLGRRLTCIPSNPAFHLPSFLQRPNSSSSFHMKDVKTLPAHLAHGLLDLLSSHRLTPTGWSEKHSSSLCSSSLRFVQGTLQRKKKREKEKRKKVSSIHPNTLEAVLGAWLQPHPCCTDHVELQPLLALRAEKNLLENLAGEES